MDMALHSVVDHQVWHHLFGCTGQLKYAGPGCSDDAHDPLPVQLLQKYIAYARQYCHPVLSNDAKQVLKDYYCRLRQDSLSHEGTPVTVWPCFVCMCGAAT